MIEKLYACKYEDMDVYTRVCMNVYLEMYACIRGELANAYQATIPYHPVFGRKTEAPNFLSRLADKEKYAATSHKKIWLKRNSRR